MRRLGPDDAAAWVALRLEALAESPAAFISAREEFVGRENYVAETALRFEAPDQVTFGAFDEGNLVGMATFMALTRQKRSHAGELVAMYVAPGSRGKGLGKALIRTVIAQAGHRGLLQLELAVSETQGAASGLYQAAGFETWGTSLRYMQVNGVFHDVHFMVLCLDRKA